MKKEHLTAFIDQVIAQGENLRRKSQQGETGESLGTNWFPRIMSVFHLLGSHADPWKYAVAKCPTDHSTNTTDKLLGVLKAIREAVNDGLLAEIEDAAQADTLMAMLERAQSLAQEEQHVAAGSVGQSILEEHLREWCERTGCSSAGSMSADDLGTALYRKGHFTKADAERIQSLSNIGRYCQANKEPPLAGAKILETLTGIHEFISTHPVL